MLLLVLLRFYCCFELYLSLLVFRSFLKPLLKTLYMLVFVAIGELPPSLFSPIIICRLCFASPNVL